MSDDTNLYTVTVEYFNFKTILLLVASISIWNLNPKINEHIMWGYKRASQTLTVTLHQLCEI